jgi:hypothetical protein
LKVLLRILRTVVDVVEEVVNNSEVSYIVISATEKGENSKIKSVIYTTLAQQFKSGWNLSTANNWYEGKQALMLTKK